MPEDVAATVLPLNVYIVSDTLADPITDPFREELQQISGFLHRFVHRLSRRARNGTVTPKPTMASVRRRTTTPSPLRTSVVGMPLRTHGTLPRKCGSAPCVCRAARTQSRTRHTQQHRPRRENAPAMHPTRLGARELVRSSRKHRRSRCSGGCISRASSDPTLRNRHRRTRRSIARSRDTPGCTPVASSYRTRQAGGDGLRAFVDRDVREPRESPLVEDSRCKAGS